MDKGNRERVGIFGGSFDPVHIGHLIIAQDALEQLELDRLIFMPAAISPHKLDCPLNAGRHRYEMLLLATQDDPRFEVSDLELERGGISYTIDTIEQLHEENPQADLFFIVGLDSLVRMHHWHRIEDLLAICTIVPLGRGGQRPEEVAEKMELPTYWKTRLMERLIRIHEIEISSTELRMRAAEGLSTRTLVPDLVGMYIAEHNLYI